MRYQGSRFPEHWRSMLADLRTSPIPALKGIASLLIAIFLFRAWRRWAEKALPALRQKVLNARPRTRRNIKVAKTLWYLDRLRTPVEWLVLFMVIATVFKLADSFQNEDPARLIIKWIFVGWAGLRLVDSIAARGGSGLVRDSSGLRLRSLKLILGWIAAFGLTRDLSLDYVGRATLHSWVWWIFLFLGIPVLLLLIHWWREEVFRRAAKEPDLPPGLQAALAKNEKKPGYVATAMVGGFLLTRGLRRRVIRFFSNFDMGRRVQAHIFRREVARQAHRRGGERQGDPLPDRLQQRILDGRQLVSKVYRPLVNSTVRQAREERGWRLALVGERGMGKSTLLTRIGSEVEEDRMLVVDCPPEGFDALFATLCQEAGADLSATSEPADLASTLREQGVEIVAVDNAHRLAAPRIGGFVQWDRTREMMRQMGHEFSWILTFNEVAFQYIDRVRADGALTAQIVALAPWAEEQIDELLKVRGKEAGIEPNYDRLELPRQLDEMSYEVEGDRKRHGFTRILWDSSQGNPAVALRMWSDSLVVAGNGDIEIQLLPQPGVVDLEDLSLTSQFVLRSIVQMEYAGLDDVVQSLNLGSSEVETALQAALARGLVEEQEGLFSISWPWFRPITRLLRRQNLLAER